MFESLDFLYVPAPNIHESIRYYTKVLDGELLWKIHAYGVWVACIRLSSKEPVHSACRPYRKKGFNVDLSGQQFR